jgi:AAHS family 4-hydroxybenzoate transporter-like MFS transporter
VNDSSARHIDVGAVLDSARFRGLPLLVMLCAACITIDGWLRYPDMGPASPALARDWGSERGALAPALAAALIEMAVGGFTLGAYGNRSGRRLALLISVACFAIGTLATTWVPNVSMLIILRFVTGIGLGGALPNATALMAEFAPTKLPQSTSVMGRSGRWIEQASLSAAFERAASG